MSTQSSSVPRRPLSVAMIVRDAADLIAASIESVRAIADEIAVLDTGSRDGTPIVAARLGAKVHCTTWSDDFSAARNHLLERLRGKWVLWLDAGERLSPETADALRAFVDREADPARVYLVILELPPVEPNGSSQQIARVRLMPRLAGLRYAGRLCETLEPAMETLRMTLDAAPGRILCHARHHRPEVKAAKAKRNLRLLGLEAGGRTELPARSLISMGDALADLDDPVAARQLYQRAIAASRRGSTEMLDAYYGLLTTLDADWTQGKNQLSVSLEALEIFPFDAQLLMTMGGYLQSRNQFDLAARAFESALLHGQVNLETWHLTEIAQLSASCLALTLQLQGRHEEARRKLEEAVQRYPNSARLRRHLVELLLRLGRGVEALRMAEGFAGCMDSGELMVEAVRGAAEAVAQNWLAALGHLQAAYLSGCQDRFCLRWLAVTLLSNGQSAAAQPILEQWLAAEPNNVEAQRFHAAIVQADTSAAAPADSARAADLSRKLRIDAGVLAPPAPLAPTTVQDVGLPTAR